MPCVPLSTKLANACTSGIAKVQSKQRLWQIIAGALCGEGSDPYDGLLVYTRQGLGTTTVVGPVGAYDLTFGPNPVTEIHCHNCPLITSIIVNTNNVLTIVDLENCATLGEIRFFQCSVLTSIDLSTFTSIPSSLYLHSCAALASVNLNSLATVGSLEVTQTGVVDFSAPLLVSASAAVTFYGNSLLETVSAPQLVSVGTSFTTLYCDNLVSLDLSSLETVGADLYISENDTIALLEFPSLVSCGGYFRIQASSALVQIDTPQMQFCDIFWINANAALTDINPDLLDVGTGYIEIGSCAFTSFDLSNQSSVMFTVNGANGLLQDVAWSVGFTDGGLYDLSGNSLTVVAVNGILASAALTMISGGDLYLDAGGNASPTGGFTNADYLTLVGNGVTVSIN